MKQFDFSIVLFNDHTNKLQFFTGIDLIMTLIWIIIFLVLCFYIKHLNKDKLHYRYFIWNFLFKLTFSIIFSFYYIFVIRGGDTIAFWDTSIRLTNLFYETPKYYFLEWGQYRDQLDYINYFTLKTGYPPGWIQREAEGYYVSKLISIVNIVSLNSYLANTVIFSFLSSISSFKLYDFIVSFGIHNYRKLALYFLFIPSLAFWCSGVSKDTIIMICLFTAIPILFNIFSKRKKINIFNIFLILLLIYILFNIRSFMILCLIGPFILALVVRLINHYIKNVFIKRVLSILIISTGIGVSLSFFGTGAAEKYLKQAEIIQKDFQNNSTYTGKKYDLGIVEFTPLGIIRTLPIAVITGIYRPFLWEALSPALILNAFESLLLIYLSLLFLFYKRNERIKRIRSNEILIYAVFFVLIMAFMTGFTSIIFGVLVRLRAPLLPFFIMILTVLPASDKSKDEIVFQENEEQEFLNPKEIVTS
jgi:hypothetical protein